jgi:hypothetical protein
LQPHLVQRAERRSTSLDASGPHRMISGTKGIGVRRQPPHTIQHHGMPRRSCSSVCVGFVPQPLPDLQHMESR